MDLVTLDVSSAPPEVVFPGAEVDVIGGPVPIDDLAEAGGTIAYELLTALAPDTAGNTFRETSTNDWRGHPFPGDCRPPSHRVPEARERSSRRGRGGP